MTNDTYSRRRALGLFAGAAALAACGKSSNNDAAAPTTTGAASSGVADASDGVRCATIPEETAGPFPGDGSNGPDVLSQDGIVRSDITSSFAGASGTAEGVPMTIELTIVDAARNCAPLEGAAVYVWHCDREARYSMYSPGATDANYLRGVQAADADGKVRFTSIFPAAYTGRWPHIHFEVYDNVADATSGTSKRATSQVALPKAACDKVYAVGGYAQSARTFATESLATDMVFSDGYQTQLGTVTGDVDKGMTVTLTVPV